MVVEMVVEIKKKKNYLLKEREKKEKKKKRPRTSRRAMNLVNKSLAGLAHRVLWMAYSVTSGIVIHSNWYENYLRDDGEEEVVVEEMGETGEMGEMAGETGESERNKKKQEDGDVASLQRIGHLLTHVWQGVLSFENVELQIDSDDREDVVWWLNCIKRVFEEETRRENKSSRKSDLTFQFTTCN